MSIVEVEPSHETNTKPKFCSKCNGTGIVAIKYYCTRCNRTGMAFIYIIRKHEHIYSRCPRCSGKGYFYIIIPCPQPH